MKSIRFTSAWILGAVGLSFASTQLLHAAQLGAEQGAQSAAAPVQTGLSGVSIASMSVEEQLKFQGLIQQFREMYGDDMLSRLTFDTREGQLSIIGFKATADEAGEGGSQGPSCT